MNIAKLSLNYANALVAWTDLISDASRRPLGPERDAVKASAREAYVNVPPAREAYHEALALQSARQHARRGDQVSPPNQGSRKDR